MAATVTNLVSFVFSMKGRDLHLLGLFQGGKCFVRQTVKSILIVEFPPEILT